MPYKLSQLGDAQFNQFTWEVHRNIILPDSRYSFVHNLTDLQKKALEYLYEHKNEDFIETSEIAKFYGLAPQAMRGVLYSLYKKGLVEKL